MTELSTPFDWQSKAPVDPAPVVAHEVSYDGSWYNDKCPMTVCRSLQTAIRGEMSCRERCRIVASRSDGS